MPVLSTIKANNMQSLVNALDNDRGVSFVQIKRDGNWEWLIEVHLHTNPGELPSCRKHSGTINLDRSANLVSQMDEHWLLKVVHGKLFESNPDGGFGADCRRRLEIGFPWLHCQIIAEQPVRASCQDRVIILRRSELNDIESFTQVDNLKFLFRFPFLSKAGVKEVEIDRFAKKFNDNRCPPG